MRNIGLVLILIVIPYVIGAAVSGKTERRHIKAYAEGVIIELAVYYVISRISLIKGVSFSQTAFRFVFASGFLAVISVVISVVKLLCRRKGRERKNGKTEKKILQWEYLLFSFLFVIQIMGYAYPTYPIREDITVETVNDILQDDGVYETNPYNGEPEKADSRYPLILEFYAFLSRAGEVESYRLVYGILPVWLCVLGYMIYYNFAKELFDGDGKRTAWFLIALCGLNIFGKNVYWSPFSKMLTQPWLGENIFCFLMIPVMGWLMLELTADMKNVHNWGMLVMAILASFLVYEKAAWFAAFMGTVFLVQGIGR